MTCLVYCVGSARLRLPRDGLRGAGGSPVRLVVDRAGELAAAVSSPALTSRQGTIDDALAHARLVEALHGEGAVVPLRFGCVLAGDDAVAELLCARRDELGAALRAVEGCVEMGVRVLAADRDEVGPRAGAPATTTAGIGAGLAYLHQRRACYAEADQVRQQAALVSERVRAALAGQCVGSRLEPAGRVTIGLDGRHVSAAAYFLVRRQSLESFRDAFRAFSRAEPTPLLLSGPWPPYNFVMPEVPWKPR